MAQILIFQMGSRRHIALQFMAHQYMKLRQVAGCRKQFCRFLYIALPALKPGLQHISAAVFQRRKAFSFPGQYDPVYSSISLAIKIFIQFVQRRDTFLRHPHFFQQKQPLIRVA